MDEDPQLVKIVSHRLVKERGVEVKAYLVQYDDGAEEWQNQDELGEHQGIINAYEDSRGAATYRVPRSEQDQIDQFARIEKPAQSPAPEEHDDKKRQKEKKVKAEQHEKQEKRGRKKKKEPKVPVLKPAAPDEQIFYEDESIHEAREEDPIDEDDKFSPELHVPLGQAALKPVLQQAVQRVDNITFEEGEPFKVKIQKMKSLIRQKYGPKPIFMSKPATSIEEQEKKFEEIEEDRAYQGDLYQQRLSTSVQVSTQTEWQPQRHCSVLSLHWDGKGIPSCQTIYCTVRQHGQVREVAGREMIMTHPSSLIGYIKRRMTVVKSKPAEQDRGQEMRYQVQEEQIQSSD